MSQNNTSLNYHENSVFFNPNTVTRYSSSSVNCRSSASTFSDCLDNSSFKGVPASENMTSKGDAQRKSKDLSAAHSGPVIIKAHNLKNRVPLSSLANVSCKKDAGITANSWMTNPNVYQRSDSTATTMAKTTNDVNDVPRTEPERPSASDNVEFALQSLFHSDTSILNSTPPIQSSKHMSAESVEKILKSPSPEKSDDEELTILYDSYANRNAPSDQAGDAKSSVTKPPVSEPANAKTTTKVLILRKKNSDIAKTSIGRTNNLTPPKSMHPINCERLNMKSVEDIEKNKCDPKNNHQISSETPSSVLTILAEKNDARPECEVSCQNVSIDKVDNKKSTFRVAPKRTNLRSEVTPYVQVENELEKMFAGVDDGSNKNPSVMTKKLNSSSTSAKSNTSISSPCTGLSQSSQNAFISPNIPAITSKKNLSRKPNGSAASMKKGKANNKQNSSSSSKESSLSIETRTVPVIHIEGSKENPINAHIVNSIKSKESELCNGKMAVKRKLGENDPAVKTNISNFSFKNHSSVSSDANWLCVFCNLPANVPGLAGEATGDLFGPYFISIPDQINSDESRKHSWNKANSEQVKKKLKQSPSTENECVDLSPSDEPKSLEVWAHENCIVWASGVYLIGSKLIGLEEAVMQALQTTCTHCNNKGASIGCRTRHCNSCVHCTCAIHMGWKLDTNDFISTCRAHSASS